MLYPSSVIRGFRCKGWAYNSRGPVRMDLEKGEFGYVPRYYCDHCGPIGTPAVVCTQRENWGPCGGDPAEYEYVCPSCHRYCCYDNDQGGAPMKAIKHSHLTLSLEQS